MPARELRRARVVGGDDHGDRRGQLPRRRGVQGVGEIAVCGHAVVPVGGTDVLGALRIQLTELGVAAVRAQPRGDLGVAPPGQLGDGGAPVGGVTEQLRAEEHPLDVHPALLQPPGRLHGERGARGVAPQQDPGQATPGDLGDDLLDHLCHRRERLALGGQVVTGQLDGVDRQPAAPQRPGQRLEVHRVAAGVGEAHQGTGRRTVRFRQRLQQPGAPLGPAVDQPGQIGEDRVTGDVLEGHRTVQGDRQLHRRQRGAAPVEEVVPPADLVLRDAEHLRPCGRQPLLGRRARRGVVLLDDVELAGERRQRLPVDLAVGGQRQTFPPVEGRRDHVLGQRLTQPVPQDVDLEWPRPE